jgi:hypothetical protein
LVATVRDEAGNMEALLDSLSGGRFIARAHTEDVGDLVMSDQPYAAINRVIGWEAANIQPDHLHQSSCRM